MVWTNSDGWTSRCNHKHKCMYTLKSCCDKYVSVTASWPGKKGAGMNELKLRVEQEGSGQAKNIIQSMQDS